MRKARPVFAIVLLVTLQLFCVLPGQGQPTLVPGITADSPDLTVTSTDASVGTINLVNSQVQTGPPENLQFLEGQQDFHNGDSVRVTEGGKGKLTLNDGSFLTLFNETEVSGVNIVTSPPETDLFLQNQGFLGHVPPGSTTTVDMPNGAKITILGTYFFVVFNRETQVATAGNFDGSVRYTPPGGTEQDLPRGTMVNIPPEGGGEPDLIPFLFTPEQFESVIDQSGTPTAGLGRLIQESQLPPPVVGQTITVTVPPVPQTGWSAWEQLDGEIIDAPTVASWGPDRLDVFARGVDNTLWHKYWASGWSDWEGLAGESEITSSPAAVSWGENRIDIFALGTDRQVWQYVWDNGWSGWFPQGGSDVDDGLLDDSPAVSTLGSNHLHLFVRRTDHNLVNKFWDGAGWSSWATLGGAPIYSTPSVVLRGADMIDIVARGESSQVLWRNALGDWTSFEGTIQDAPALISRGPERMDLFVRSTDNSLLHSTWNPATSWSDWENLGGPIYSAPAAVSWGPGRIDVFARGEAGNLIHISYQE